MLFTLTKYMNGPNEKTNTTPTTEARLAKFLKSILESDIGLFSAN